MPGLDGQDRAGGCQVAFIHNGRRGTEVGGDANTLKHAGGRDEASSVGDAESIGTFGNGVGACGFEGGGEEGDVGLLVTGDYLDLLADGRREAGLAEGLGRVVGQTLAVEGVFEVLEGEGIVEDLTWKDW